jgi:hypothetical protein
MEKSFEPIHGRISRSHIGGADKFPVRLAATSSPKVLVFPLNRL